MIAALKPYPAMKDSGVAWLGDVPEHWETRKLRSVLRRVTERNRPDLPLLSVVREKGVIVRDTTATAENHNFIPDDLSSYKVVRAGQFAMNKMKAWQGSYGVSDLEGIVSPAYFVFHLSGVDGRFFHSAIRSRAYVPSFAQASDGVRIGQWDLGEPRMREIPFAVPPVAEQTAIVRFLDHADRRFRRYIRAKQKLIKLLEEQKQTIIHQAVTRGLDPNVRFKPSGVAWLGDVPEHWVVASLRHRYDQCLGKMLDTQKATGHHPTHYLRNVDVRWDAINVRGLPVMDIAPEERSRFTLKVGDLLVCEGRHLGRAAFWRGDLELCGFQKALHRLRALDSSRDSPRFLYYCLLVVHLLDAFGASSSDNSIPHLTGEMLRAHRFPFPPREEQDGIALHLDSMTTAGSRASQETMREINLLGEYRTRLIADVVTGKLDVRGAAARLPDEADELEVLDEADTLTDDEEVSTDEVNEASTEAGV